MNEKMNACEKRIKLTAKNLKKGYVVTEDRVIAITPEKLEIKAKVNLIVKLWHARGFNNITAEDVLKQYPLERDAYYWEQFRSLTKQARHKMSLASCTKE